VDNLIGFSLPPDIELLPGVRDNIGTFG